MRATFNVYLIDFFLFVVIVATEIYIVFEKFNCLIIMVHEIQPGDGRTERQTNEQTT